MKKLCMVLSLAGVMAAPNLFASMSMSVTLMDNTSQYSYGNGGEFRAVGNSSLDSIVDWNAYATTTKGTVTAATDGSSWGYGSGLNGQQYFQTFCTELLEEFSPGSSYTISSIGNNAMYNQNAGPNGIPITLGIAYLYSQFAAGTLGGYDYTGAGRTTSAGNLQNAIWYLLGEGGSLTDAALTDLQNSGIVQANWTAAANGAYGVKDMVLLQPGQAQDQLVIVPEPTTMIAGALLLLPFGASTLRILRKNRVA